MTGTIMIMISTDMYHHCGPRVAFWAATVSGSVCALALERKSASRYSFQAKTARAGRSRRGPGVDSGSTIDQKIRKREAPSIVAALLELERDAVEVVAHQPDDDRQVDRA